MLTRRDETPARRAEGAHVCVEGRAPSGWRADRPRHPGITEADLPYVFDRFCRSPAARSLPGSGLGLAIVRQIAETHGSTVAAVPPAPGVRLRMMLPPLT
ncbi:sensor histidine kinase [Streptomyces humicola]|uniref:sensor histidine kinase n=1 Tax=Streptomyces humicola TaxID=2953240 RepID=UPI0021096926